MAVHYFPALTEYTSLHSVLHRDREQDYAQFFWLPTCLPSVLQESWGVRFQDSGVEQGRAEGYGSMAAVSAHDGGL